MRRVSVLAGVVLGTLISAVASAQPFPSKPVKIVVSYPPGGVVDVLARPLAQGLQQHWNTAVVVDNKPGANAIIGTAYAAKQPADGYTVLFANDPSLSSNQYLYSKLPYDPVKDFVPVVTVATTTLILAVHPSVPANNLAELIALARQKPNELSYGSFGPGSVTHLDTEAFAAATGITLLHVPYKGTADVVTALVAGQISMAFGAIGPVTQHIREGRLKAIAVASSARQPLVLEVPTFTEAGLPGFEARSWFGLAVPTGTPRPVIDRIAADVRNVVAQPEYIRRYILELGLEPFDLGPDQFAQYLTRDRAKYAERVKTVNVRLD